MVTQDITKTDFEVKPTNVWQSRFRRYWMLCKISFQERMEYRWNIFMYMGLVLLPTLIAIYLWGVIFQGKSDPAATARITTYYVVAAFVSWRIAQFQWFIMFDVREGKLANSLLRPMSYPATAFWYEAGGRTWSTILTLPVFVVLAFALGNNFQTPSNPWTWLLVILSFLLSYLLSFFLTASLGLLTIWQNQPEGFFVLYDIAARWLGGSFVPIALMPAAFGNIVQWLPFAYIYSLPVRIYQGLSTEALVQGLGVQVIWLGLCALLFRWLWGKAVRRYEVFEG